MSAPPRRFKTSLQVQYCFEGSLFSAQNRSDLRTLLIEQACVAPHNDHEHFNSYPGTSHTSLHEGCPARTSPHIVTPTTFGSKAGPVGVSGVSICALLGKLAIKLDKEKNATVSRNDQHVQLVDSCCLIRGSCISKATTFHTCGFLDAFFH